MWLLCLHISWFKLIGLTLIVELAWLRLFMFSICVTIDASNFLTSLQLPPLAVLVSRQFVDMSRIRIEGLLAAFPKLVGTGKQHTYVETENVRYVYQPIDTLYLLLVTNKQSNILEDLDTLRVLSKLISFAGLWLLRSMWLCSFMNLIDSLQLPFSLLN